MIDFYEKVDFDQEVWTLDGGKLEQQVLRDVCWGHGDPDGKYRAEGCELLKYRANHQLPRSVVATFDSDAEAEHAYWLLLLDYVTTTDNTPMIFWDAFDVAEWCAGEVSEWDGERIETLRYWLRALDRVCEYGGLEQQHFVDMSNLGGVTLPDDVDTSYPVWAMDAKGDMLVGDRADDIEHVDKFRWRCGGWKHHKDAARFHDLMGGWLLINSDGWFQVETDEGVVKDLRGEEWMDECDRQQCWDETMLKEAA